MKDIMKQHNRACLKEAIRNFNIPYIGRCLKAISKEPIRSGLRVCHGYRRVYRLFV